jgi:uroporphyrin-III C-methyltransferase/precorrin-2 dehydrogenase/sirohydrochlorin ferrochelatase
MTVHVDPQETRPARLASLPKLPIFLDLQGRRAVVVGGNEAAPRKSELVAAAGAGVVAFAAEPCEELRALAKGGAVTIVPRTWKDGDLAAASLVVAAEDDGARAEALVQAARRCGVLVNVIDQPALCDFQFGTIVNRAPVVIGISTDGAAPILGQAIRRRIEAVLPAGLGGWAAAAKDFRSRLKQLLPSRTARRAFWERFVDLSFARPLIGEDPTVLLERLGVRIRDADSENRVGEIVIVGAGPGDSELLTMRAVRELQAADVILYDSLVTSDVLELGRREARRILVGKRGHAAACRQDEICALMTALARAGQRVVRLKGGDPSVFGRTGEELAACRTAGIAVRVVPGVTSASAAAAALGVSLTHRDHAQRLQFVTGHGRDGGLPRSLALDALADPCATTVVYMARRTIGILARLLLKRGLSASTPAVVVRDVSRPTEAWARTHLAALADATSEPHSSAPTLVLIGNAVAAPAIRPTPGKTAKENQS